MFSQSQILRQAKENAEKTPHKVSIVKCTNCQKRWTAVRPESVRIYELECPLCGKIGYAKETGEVIKNGR